MKTFAEIRESVMGSIFVDDEPENLKPHHTKDLMVALMDLQHYIPRLMTKNTSTFRMCSSYFYCGSTVVPAPRGQIQSVYSLEARANCCPIYYDFIESYDEFINWVQATRRSWDSPVQPSTLPALNGGFQYASAETDKGYRYNWGNWTLRNGRIYVGYHLESTEILCVDWKGKKRSYQDTDMIEFGGDVPDPDDEGLEVMEALGYYVLSKHNTLYAGDPVNGSRLMLEYFSKRAKLIKRYRDEEIPEAKPDRDYNQPVVVEGCRAPDCTPEEESEDVLLFAVISDVGTDLDASANVAALVESWGPEFIVSTGDNWNNTSEGNTLAALDETFGQFYRTFLYPYRGTSGVQVATEQRYFPSLGNHDRDPEGRLDIVRDFFNLPPNNGQPSKGYYDVVKGPVHFFMIDSGYNGSGVNQQDDGNTETSPQAAWLRSKLASSTAPWKIVLFHHPPYASMYAGGGIDPYDPDGFLAYPALRWPFRQWGAHVVLNGHNHHYERLSVNGFPYIIVGTSGSHIDAFDENHISPYSIVRNANTGAVRVYATCEYLTFQRYNVDGVLVEQFSMSKAVDTEVPTAEPVVTIPGAPVPSTVYSSVAFNPLTGNYHRLMIDTDVTTGALQVYVNPAPVS